MSLAYLKRSHFAEVSWPQPYKESAVTERQLQRIRSRRCGPVKNLRLPEELYKASLKVVLGVSSYTEVETKGQAEELLTLYDSFDEDSLAAYTRFRAVAIKDVTCRSCAATMRLPDTFQNIRCAECGEIVQ